MSEEISFGRWLRQKRRALDLTQKALANQVGCAEITVRRMEADTYRPSKELAFVLFEELGIPELERPQWVRFARGLAKYPTPLPISYLTNVQTTHLPLSLTSFIRREKEQTEIANLIAKKRLVTLTGVGGIGKTRISIQIASTLVNDFPDGIWLVEFAPLSDPALVAQVASNTLGLIDQVSRSPQRILTGFLLAKKALLVFDNCEHLIKACAELTGALLKACPGVKILATSREALGIDGESVYLVPSLATPDFSCTTIENLPNYEAVQLFIERAQTALPNFELTQENATAIAQVCHQLDGIPLALELAAARVKLLRVEEIAARLDDRFQLLSSGSRTALPRHQTLQAMVDWSHDLLTENERVLLRRMSIFAGGWTLEAAENICADEGEVRASEVFDLLASLVNKSLVIAERKQGEETRYSMLETIRQYAHEKLWLTREKDLMRNRHLTYFMRLAELGDQRIHGSAQVEWMDRLEREMDNFRAAVDWCLSKRHTRTVLCLLNALGQAWVWRGYFSEIESWFEKILALPEITTYPTPYARLLNFMGQHYRLVGEFRRAQSIIEDSQRIWLKLGAEGEQGLAQALSTLGEIALYEEDTRTARSLFERSFGLYKKHGNQQGLATLIFNFGNLAFVQGRYTDAEEQYMKSLAKFQALGDQLMVAWVLSGLGEMMRVVGNYERAEILWEQNLKIFQEIRWRSALAYPIHALASVSLRKGDLDKARTLFKESARLFNEFGERNGAALCIAGLAGISGMIGKPERAAYLFGAAEIIFENTSQREPADQKDFNHYVNIVRGQLEESVFEDLWAEGRTITMEQAIEFALEEN